MSVLGALLVMLVVTLVVWALFGEPGLVGLALALSLFALLG